MRRPTRPYNERNWLQRHATNLLRIALVVLFLFLAAWAIYLNHYNRVIASSEPWLLLTDALVSVGPELAGIAIGFVTIDYLNERRQTEQLKGQLIRQMGMNIREVAVPAAAELAHHGWLSDGSVSGISATGADLSGARLYSVDLSRASLVGTKLVGAELSSANLSGAMLWRADLTRAGLTAADLSGASFFEASLREVRAGGVILCEASLSGADLRHASLVGADLTGAMLRNADLAGADLGWAQLTDISDWTVQQLALAKSLDGAVMPDGTRLGDPGEFVTGLGMREPVEGPTFEAWVSLFLSANGGTQTDLRNPGKADSVFWSVRRGVVRT